MNYRKGPGPFLKRMMKKKMENLKIFYSTNPICLNTLVITCLWIYESSPLKCVYGRPISVNWKCDEIKKFTVLNMAKFKSKLVHHCSFKLLCWGGPVSRCLVFVWQLSSIDVSVLIFWNSIEQPLKFRARIFSFWFKRPASTVLTFFDYIAPSVWESLQNTSWHDAERRCQSIPGNGQLLGYKYLDQASRAQSSWIGLERITEGRNACTVTTADHDTNITDWRRNKCYFVVCDNFSVPMIPYGPCNEQHHPVCIKEG